MKKCLLYPTLTSTLIVLAGCQILPDFSSPKAPIPEKFSAPINDAPSAADIGWREFFQNAELQHVIEQALANNRDLKATALRIEEARALYGIQRADQLPTVNATAGGTNTRALLGANRVEYTSYQVGLGMTAF